MQQTKFKPLTSHGSYFQLYSYAGISDESEKDFAIRVTKDEFCKMLIGRFRKPIVSTSANLSGNPPPTSFSAIDKEILSGVDYIVNLRQQEKTTSSPSTIIKLGLGGEIKIIRR